MRGKHTLWLICLSLFLFMTACSDKDDSSSGEEKQPDESEEQKTVSADPAEVELLDYAEEIGLSLESPASEVETVLELNGTIEKANDLNEDFLWVTVKKMDKIEEIKEKRFEYYIPVQDGQFSKKLNLHHGEGEYKVTVRVSSDDAEEEGTYYEAANFRIANLDEGIERDIEYTKYGLVRELELSEPIKGWNHAEEFIEIEGNIGDNYAGDVLLAEVKKDGEKNTVSLPIYEGSFSGEIPLSFGEGTHSIQLKLITDDEDDKENTYYDSATFYVNNESARELPKINQHATYLDSGVILDKPGWDSEIEQDTIEYPVKGKIDKNSPRADEISHVIVELKHLDESEVATYFIPVENYEFDGITHFRFGPGEYEVKISIPSEDQGGIGSTFYFTSILSINHSVVNIEDQRDILPARGIESNDPKIIKKAEEITDGAKGEREKAKAVYEFVSKHVEYDVEKFKKDIFNLDDSALATLESGIGICQDYTFLTTALLRSIDIESRYVEGHAGGRHAWVEAKVDGEWIEMDPTWGAGYVDGDEFHFQYNEDYFDPDPDLLEKTHTRQGIMY